MAIHSGDDWQGMTRCLFGVDRWRVVLVTSDGGEVAVKGISEADAWELADKFDGVVYRSRVWVFADRTEQLDPWDEVVRGQACGMPGCKCSTRGDEVVRGQA